MDLFLSTTDSKFDRQLILDDKVFTPIYSYDVDISQKSRLVTLTAGQRYYFEMWHKEGIGGSYFSVAWKTPGGTRQLIPTQYLSSYGGEANDQDDDYLKDDYELANGLSITDDGKNPGSKDGIYGDLDGDGLTNGQEMKAGTKSNLADSDGDGVSDFDEANFFDSSTLANTVGAFTPVTTLTGDAYTTNFGEWIKSDGKAIQDCRRGSVTYPVTVTSSGIHALKFAISSTLDGSKSEQYEFDLKLNGKRIAYKTINIQPDGSATLAVLSPWLNAGETYQLELFVDNSYNFRRVSIDSLQILAAGGTDSNNNGTPDWVDIREHETNGFDSTAILSKTSPATVEGNVKYFDLLNSNGAAVIQAPNGRFFTEVPLTPGTPSTLNFAFENAAVTESATVQWLPTNLLQETTITLRQGDSLLLTAFQNAENASLESYSYTVNGIIISKTSDQPTAQLFATAGTQTISMTHTAANATVTTWTLMVNVVPLVTIPPPICVTGYTRLWNSPTLPIGCELIFDNRVGVTLISSGNYRLYSEVAGNVPLIVRHGATGSILGYSVVKNVCVRTSDSTGCIMRDITNSYTDVDLPIVVTGDSSMVDIRCDIIIGGVSFMNGATTQSINVSELNQYDTFIFSMRIPKSAHSNCHKISVWQNGSKIM